MQNTFITKIHIDKVRHLENVDIVLSDTERKHLILTGKNGSGKTSLLEEMCNSVLLSQYNSQRASASTDKLDSNELGKYFHIDGSWINSKMSFGSGVKITYSAENPNLWQTVFAYISVNRNKFDVPKSIEPIAIRGKNIINRNASKEFLKYILNMDYQLYGAQADGNTALKDKIEKWFIDFQEALRNIYDHSELKLLRDTKNLTFRIKLPGREPFGLNEMSDGYAAFLDIYMELMMRLENAEAVVKYEQPAFVLIDEIETHLHVELQKRVLPFLTIMFPNVQFIVATHSPFVISSLADVVVFDLEKKIRLEDASLYSYEEIIEGFYDIDNVSLKVKDDFERYKTLCETTAVPSDTKEREIIDLRTRLERVSPANKSLFLAFSDYERRRRYD